MIEMIGGIIVLIITYIISIIIGIKLDKYLERKNKK